MTATLNAPSNAPVDTLKEDIEVYAFVSAHLYMPWWYREVQKDPELFEQKGDFLLANMSIIRGLYERLMKTEYGTEAVYFIHQTIIRMFAHYGGRLGGNEENIFNGGEKLFNDLEMGVFEAKETSTEWMMRHRSEAIPFADKVVGNAISVLLTDIMQKYEKAAYALPACYYEQEKKLADDIYFFRHSKYSSYMVDLMVPAIRSFLLYSGRFNLAVDPKGYFIAERFNQLEQKHAATLIQPRDLKTSMKAASALASQLRQPKGA